MNNEIQKFARNWLKENLAKCTEKQQTFFKRMYCGDNINLSVAEVIEQMPEDELDWAMEQVENTLKLKEENTKQSNNLFCKRNKIT